MPKGAVQSVTDFGTPGYGGPCPPKGDRPHRYVFTVHALKVEKLDLDEKSMPALVGFMVEANRLDKATFTSHLQSQVALGWRSTLPALSLLETRVLGVLVEKQHTVPDTYPLTLNALIAGCNQKTSRDPILDASEAEVQAALDHLRALSLVVESSGGRVMRYAHNVERVLRVPSQAVALLAALMLRGPQTVGELRINCERLHRFADISAVEGFLHELAARRADGALVVELPRQPGARETRWMHLLSGAPAERRPRRQADAGDGLSWPPREIAALKANVARLAGGARRAEGDRREGCAPSSASVLTRPAGRFRLQPTIAATARRSCTIADAPSIRPRQPFSRSSDARAMDIPGMFETAKPMLIAFGLKVARRDRRSTSSAAC